MSPFRTKRWQTIVIKILPSEQLNYVLGQIHSNDPWYFFLSEMGPLLPIYGMQKNTEGIPFLSAQHGQY